MIRDSSSVQKYPQLVVGWACRVAIHSFFWFCGKVTHTKLSYYEIMRSTNRFEIEKPNVKSGGQLNDVKKTTFWSLFVFVALCAVVRTWHVVGPLTFILNLKPKAQAYKQMDSWVTTSYLIPSSPTVWSYSVSLGKKVSILHLGHSAKRCRRYRGNKTDSMLYSKIVLCTI